MEYRYRNMRCRWRGSADNRVSGPDLMEGFAYAIGSVDKGFKTLFNAFVVAVGIAGLSLFGFAALAIYLFVH